MLKVLSKKIKKLIKNGDLNENLGEKRNGKSSRIINKNMQYVVKIIVWGYL